MSTSAAIRSGWIDTIQSIVLFVGFISMAILAVHQVGGRSHIQQAVDPAAQSLLAVDGN